MSDITSDLCRLCLKESFTLHDIYSSHSTSGDLIYRVLNYVYDLEITPDDGLLTQICAPCMWKMLEFEGYKRNVHFARVEIVKLLSKLTHASTGCCDSDERPIESDSAQEVGCDSHESNEGTIEADSAQGLSMGDFSNRENHDMSLESDSAHSVPADEEIDIEEWQMPKELKRQAIDIEGQGMEPDLHNDANIMNIDNGSGLSKVVLQAMDTEVKQKESEPMNDEVGAIQSTVSSDSRNHSSLDASEETVVNSFEGESICTTEDNSFVIREANEGITEEDSIDEVVPEEETTSAQLSECILNDTESEMSHLKDPLSMRKSVFTCDICKKSFTRKWDIGNHVRVHNDERPFSCNVCKKSFKQDNVRYVHELRHLRDKMSFGKSKEGSKTNQYSCVVCAKNFSTRKVLHKHSNLHSDKYKCIFCRKCFGGSENLKKHVRIHTKEKPFKCEVCSKCFTQNCSLKRHLLMHSSEKSFSCDTCDKRFKTKEDKSRHALFHLRKE